VFTQNISIVRVAISHHYQEGLIVNPCPDQKCNEIHRSHGLSAYLLMRLCKFVERHTAGPSSLITLQTSFDEKSRTEKRKPKKLG
jgi:hypothetical protein